MESEDLLKLIDSAKLTLTTDSEKKLPDEIRWLHVQTHFAAQPALLQRSHNVVGQQMAPMQNTAAFIGNTGGLPTTDVQLFTLANGDRKSVV